jgi:CTP synthase
MEILELPDHPFFVGTQFHPEFRSRPGDPSPPFVGLVDAAVDRREERVDVDVNVEEVA